MSYAVVYMLIVVPSFILLMLLAKAIAIFKKV